MKFLFVLTQLETSSRETKYTLLIVRHFLCFVHCFNCKFETFNSFAEDGLFLNFEQK